MSKHSLQARCHLASPNCKIPVKQEMFQVVDSRQNPVLVSSVNVNPIYSVLSTLLHGKDNRDEWDRVFYI